MLSAKIKTHLIKLHQKKYRQQFGEFIVEGLKSTEAAIQSSWEVKFIVMEDGYDRQAEIETGLVRVKKPDIRIIFCNKKDGEKIKTTDTFPGILAVVSRKKFVLDDLLNDTPIFAFDSISNPGNLGTIVRTADWFGHHNILLSENSVEPYNEKVVRGTMGSIFSAKIFQSQDIKQSLKTLKDKKYKIILLDASGEDISSLKPENKTVYLFGSEARGVVSDIDKLADKIYAIKGGKGGAESLNVSIAAAIVISKI